MDTLEFAKNIPAQKLAEIFKNYFEQHMAVYDMLKGIEFISLNEVNINTASIIYSVKLLDIQSKNDLIHKLQQSSGLLNIYGKVYKPDIYLNGDLLCITLNK